MNQSFPWSSGEHKGYRRRCSSLPFLVTRLCHVQVYPLLHVIVPDFTRPIPVSSTIKRTLDDGFWQDVVMDDIVEPFHYFTRYGYVEALNVRNVTDSFSRNFHQRETEKPAVTLHIEGLDPFPHVYIQCSPLTPIDEIWEHDGSVDLQLGRESQVSALSNFRDNCHCCPDNCESNFGICCCCAIFGEIGAQVPEDSRLHQLLVIHLDVCADVVGSIYHNFAFLEADLNATGSWYFGKLVCQCLEFIDDSSSDQCYLKI